MRLSIWEAFMAANPASPARVSKAVQFAIVLACSGALTLLADAYHFRSPWNVLWYFGPPILLAIACNAGPHNKFRMAVWLSAFSFLTIMVVGFAFGLGD
jgi:hypothetical protein